MLRAFGFLSAVVVAAVGCGSGSAGGVTPADADGGSSGAGGDGGPGGVASGVPRVVYAGRIDDRDEAGPRVGWPDTRVIARFRGTGLTVKLLETNLFTGPSTYDVVVDGATRADPFSPADGLGEYEIAANLSPRTHVVELRRRTEAQVAVTQFLAFDFTNGGELLAPPAAPDRRIEFLGDSESTGYGVECADPTTDFSGATENASKAFPALVTAALLAESHNVSFSGKGVLRNDDDSAEVFSSIYLQSVPALQAGVWDFRSWTPAVVWIGLGANDWSPGTSGNRPAPDPETFKAKYRDLVALVREKNPSAHIVCAVESTVNDDYPAGYLALTNLRAVLKAVVDERHGAPFTDAKVHYHELPRAREADLTGCDSHPSAALHARMAASVVTKIRQITAWE